MRYPTSESVFLWAFLLVSCGGDKVTSVDPDPPDPDPDPPALEIHVTVHPDEQSLASELGWSGGVPDALIQYARVDERQYQWDTVRADALGKVLIEGPEAGLYWVAAERQISSTEAERIGVLPRAAGLLGGGEKVTVQREGTVSLEVSVRLDRPGSLVISEVFVSSPPSWEMGDQTFYGGRYLELHNNSDQTVFLDGMVLGVGYFYWYDYGEAGHHTCAVTESMRNDPDFLWSFVARQFPGSGAEYPLGPGETAVIAVQAQDHSQVHTSLLDLSGADFELYDPAGADNPAAPNLLPVGPQPHPPRHGLEWNLNQAFFFLSEAVSVETLPVLQDPGEGLYDRPYRGYPREDILDATVVWYAGNSDNVLPFCQDPAYPGFDRLPGGYIAGGSVEVDVSAARRLLTLLDGSGTVLLDTGTSRVDFVRADQTPGWIR